MSVHRLRIYNESVEGEESVSSVREEGDCLDLNRVRTLQEEVVNQIGERMDRDALDDHPWMVEQRELHGEEEPGIVVGAISSTVFIAPEGCDPEDQTEWISYYRKPAQVALKKKVSLIMGTRVMIRRRKGGSLRKSSFLLRVIETFE